MRPIHHHAVHRVIGVHGDRVARGSGHRDHSHRLIRRAFGRVAHVVAFADLLIAVGVDVGPASSKTDARRLQTRIRLPYRFQNSLFQNREVGRLGSVSALPGTASRRRVVIVRRVHNQVIGRDPQLRHDGFNEFVAIRKLGGIHADQGRLRVAVVQHESSRIQRIVDAAVNLPALEREHVFGGTHIHSRKRRGSRLRVRGESIVSS
jgi:hypothetical protein